MPVNEGRTQNETANFLTVQEFKAYKAERVNQHLEVMAEKDKRLAHEYKRIFQFND